MEINASQAFIATLSLVLLVITIVKIPREPEPALPDSKENRYSYGLFFEEVMNYRKAQWK